MLDLRQDTSNKISNTNHLQKICQICYKERHLASNCRKLIHFSLQTFNKSNLETEILICQKYKKRRYSADKCQLRDSQIRQS